MIDETAIREFAVNNPVISGVTGAFLATMGVLIVLFLFGGWGILGLFVFFLFFAIIMMALGDMRRANRIDKRK